MGDIQEMGQLPCGCLRGGLVCEEAKVIAHDLEAAFTEGLCTGRWWLFDLCRDALEAHHEGTRLNFHAG